MQSQRLIDLSKTKLVALSAITENQFNHTMENSTYFDDFSMDKGF